MVPLHRVQKVVVNRITTPRLVSLYTTATDLYNDGGEG